MKEHNVDIDVADAIAAHLVECWNSKATPKTSMETIALAMGLLIADVVSAQKLGPEASYEIADYISNSAKIGLSQHFSKEAEA